MSALGTLVRRLAGDAGVELDEEELERLGLSGDDEDQRAPDETLSEELPGTASGRVELFLAADSTSKAPAIPGSDGLMYEPIIRTGQWAVRPGQTGAKRRVPLKVVAGSSKNQRREIGLADIKSAFDDEAVQHVTVPLSHANTLTENQGFIDKLKIVEGEAKDQKTKKMEKCSVLLGGYRITEPDTKGKMERGTYANRSAGLLYDYVDTERGQKWPVVLEHVALTNKPWITGMANFGRKLAGATALDTVGLSLSDDGPSDDEYALALSEEAVMADEDLDFLADESGDWSKEGSPNWLRSQVDQILRTKRYEKQKARRANGNSAYLEDGPYYQCREAKPGKALISDGYSDDANYWAAPITVKEGAVELSDFTDWKALKKAFIPDERPDPPKDQLPLSEKQGPPKSRLELAQEARRRRAVTPGEETNQDTREVVKQEMSDTSTQLSDLSPEVRRMVEEANARAEAAEAEKTQLSERLDRVIGTVNSGEVNKYLDHLRDTFALTEAKGFGGVLTAVSDLMLADDGEPAVQSDNFATDGNKDGELSLSDSIKRIFGALEKAQEGKTKLGELLSQPADAEEKKDDEEDKGDKKDEPGTSASDDNPTGKPGADDKDKKDDQLSTDQKVDQIVANSPEMAALLGRRPEKVEA